MTTIFLTNVFSSLFLCGLIWMVQVVHYPMFHKLGKEGFISHMDFHQKRISRIVIPVMIAELITSGVLAFYAEQFQFLHATGLIVVLLIWLTTFLFQVPLHSRLTEGYDSSAVNKLCSTNWIRTFLWTIKSGIALYIQFLWL